MSTSIDFKKIAQAALSRSRSLVPTLLPEGVEKCGEWVTRNPKRNDRSPGSFQINLNSGRWADFAAGDKGGDLISLVAYLDGISQLDAAKKLLALLGGS